jgi:hypothetical protein
MYAEASQFVESPDLRAQAPSNYSTACGASAIPAIGSPHSIHSHIAPVPKWRSQGLGPNPSIVGFDGFGQSNEFSFNALGMEELVSDFSPARQNDSQKTAAHREKRLI